MDLPLIKEPDYFAQNIVLWLPELLSYIFEQCTQATQAACARVCRNWEVPALSALWRSVSGPEPLFSLLGELDDHLRSGWAFRNSIPLDRWPRFARYAHWVHDLTLFTFIRTLDAILYPVSMVALLHGAPHIFPSLRTLRYHYGGSSYERMQSSLVLLHPNLLNLHIQLLAQHSSEGLSKYFKDMAFIIHQLKTLNVGIKGGSSPDIVAGAEFADGLRALIGANPLLKSINLPTVLATSQGVWEVITRLEHLKELTYDDVYFPLAPVQIVTNDMTLDSHMLPSIHRLLLDLENLEGSARSIFSHRVPPSLREINIMMEGIIPQIIRDLSPRGSSLNSLTIHFGISHQCGFSDIQPLLSLTQLTVLNLTFGIWPSFEDADIATIASSFPHLTTLGLLFYPFEDDEFDVGYSPNIISFNALLPIAQHCRDLCFLAICPASGPPPTSRSISLAHTFSRTLKSINFGPSLQSAESRLPIAFFLSMICPDGVCICSETPWFRTDEGLSEAVKFWANMAGLLSQVTQFKNALLQREGVVS